MALLTALLALLVAFQLKHFVADYPLQGKYMLGKFSADPRVWIPALSAHAAVHALFTALITSWAYYLTAFQHSNQGTWLRILGLAAFDFVAHFAMDRVKASPNLLGRFKSLSARDFAYYESCVKSPNEHPNVYKQVGKIFRGNKLFWWALGLDQMWHHLTHYAIIVFLVTHS